MEAANFADIEAEFLARIRQVVYCTMATVDSAHRPRLRIMHPIWEGSTGWVISWPGSFKARHLGRNPAVSLAYMPEKTTPIYEKATTAWVETAEEKQRIWELHKATPAPVGFDPEPHYGTIEHPYYGVLRLTPWRIELGNLGGEPVIWRPPT
jgi:general stress protein 26